MKYTNAGTDARHRYGKARDYAFGIATMTLREKAHLTQADLARWVGVSTRALQNWEGGSSYPKDDSLRKLIEAYVRHRAFTPGNETEEAESLWEKVRQVAPRPRPQFDQRWFQGLLKGQPPVTPLDEGHSGSQREDLSQANTNGHRALSPSLQVGEDFSRLSLTNTRREDWGEAIDVSTFYGREADLATLERWIVADHCRLVAILGFGGIGKTALSVKLSHRIADSFECILWHSLRNAPHVGELIASWITFISERAPENLPDSLEGKLSLLMKLLQKQRCLLVLDNLETLLQQGNRDGRYQKGYEDYGRLFQRIGEVDHRSCLVITSREKPKEIGPLEGTNAPVRSLKLAGLTRIECQGLLKGKELVGDEVAWAKLVQGYAGNPLALKMIAETIHEVFDGDLAAFLHEETLLFNDLQLLIGQQFERLPKEEQKVMYRLCIERELVSLESLAEELVPTLSRKQVLEAMEALLRRSLIERGSQGAAFTLQPMVMEYVTEHLIEHVAEEIMREQPSLFTSHLLMKAQSKEYIRRSQVRFLLKPLLERLLLQFREEGLLEDRFIQLLAVLRDKPAAEQGYGAGNIINVLVQLKGDLRGYDFSRLTIRQAYLQGVELQDVNFIDTSFRESVFTDTLDAVLCVTFSPDNAYLAAGSANGEVRLWYVVDWQPYATFYGHTDWVWSLSFSPDGQFLASSSEDHSIKVWEVATGRCLTTLQEYTNWVKSVAFSPDGNTLATGGIDGRVRLWEVCSGRCLTVLDGHTGRVHAVTFSPDGHLLASGSEDQTIKLWEVVNGECFATLHGHSDWVRSVSFSPDGRQIASGSNDRTLRLWETQDARCLQVLVGHTNWVKSVAFSPDGRLVASGSDDQTVRIWEAKSGRCRHVLQGHTNRIWSVTFSPNSRLLASGGSDQTVHLWEMNPEKCLKVLHGHTNYMWSVAFSPDGQWLATGSNDQLVRIWETGSGKCLHALHGHTNWVKSVAFSPDGRLLASGSEDQTVRIWESGSGKCLHILQGHTNRIWSVAFSPDGNLLASGGSDQIRVWEVRSGKCLRVLWNHDYWVWSVAFSPDGETFASGSSDQIVNVWKVDSGKYRTMQQCRASGDAIVSTCAEAPPHRSFEQPKQGSENGSRFKVLYGHGNRVWSVAFSPNGGLLASGGEDQAVHVWQVDSGQCTKTLSGHRGAVLSVRFNSNGSMLASGSEDQTIKLWELASGRCIKTLKGHTSRTRSVAFSPDNETLVSSSDDGTIKLWNIQTGACLRTLQSDRPYERMNITNVKGLSNTQKAMLKKLGAIESETDS